MGNIKLFMTRMILVLLLQPALQGNANVFDNPPCPLPPPATLNIANVSLSSLTLTWTATPGAAQYKVSVFDLTDQTSLADSYTTATNIDLLGLNTLSHSYLIGVSASACDTGNDFGNEIQITYEPGIIIVIDNIVQVCPNAPVSHEYSAGQSLQLPVPPNSNRGDGRLSAKHVRITDKSRADVFVDFYIWGDCNDKIRYKEAQKSGLKLVSAGNVLTYYFTSSNTKFMDLNKESCPVPCEAMVFLGVNTIVDTTTCTIANLPSTCGNKTGPAGPPSVRSTEDDALETDVQNETAGEELTATGLRASPNPFSDHLDIRYAMEQDGPVALLLLDARGAFIQDVVKQQWQPHGSYSTAIQLPAQLPAGTYFLILQTSNRRIAIPLVKQ